jgi:hypothetical protein
MNYWLLNLVIAPFVLMSLRLIANWTWTMTISVWLSVVYCVYVVTALLEIGWIHLG